MKASKQHFQIVAPVLRAFRDNATDIYAAQHADHLAYMFADEFERNQPGVPTTQRTTFDRERFLRDCGVRPQKAVRS